MASFLKSLSEKDQTKVAKWAEERLNPRHETDIPPELYTIAELGYYYGWGAVETFYRGYIESRDDDGKIIKLPFGLDLAIALCKAAQKVYYRKLVENGDIIAASKASMYDQTYAEKCVEFANNVRKEAH